MDENIEDLQTKLALVSSVLGAKHLKNETSEYYDKFHKLLTDDYMKFAANEDTLADEAGALTDLQNIEKDLARVGEFPILFTKNIIAVAGGFSSGKSKFLNTFFKGNEIQLSVGIKPVTAIPTFIVSDSESKVTAYTPDGRQGNLPVEIFSKIDHNMIDSLGFSLKSIMPYVTVSAPFADTVSSLINLCFIDTPGYDAAGANTEEDKSIAMDSISYANAVLWLVKLGDGTIHNTDIEFLSQITDKKIFIICTKADLRKSQIQKIMSEIRDKLDENGILYEGITAYSANENTEYLFEEDPKSIFDFLNEFNSNAVDTALRCRILLKRLDEVFERYKLSISADLKRIENLKKQVNDVRIKIEKQIDKKNNEIADLQRRMSSNFYERYKSGNIGHSNESDDDIEIDFGWVFEDKSIQDNKNLSELKRINYEMKDCIKKTFGNLKVKCPKCGHEIDLSADFCDNCGAQIKLEDNSELTCQNCGCEIDSDTVFCPNCGIKIKQ